VASYYGMSLRDPRISKAVQIAFPVMPALWLLNFALQDTHTTSVGYCYL
jgi:hypothetical protein